MMAKGRLMVIVKWGVDDDLFYAITVEKANF
jgi:hypothetical protein